MRRRGFLLGLAALLALAGTAEARMHAPYRGHRMVSTVKLLDGMTAIAGGYSLRKLRSAYTGPSLKVQRTSDSQQLDVNFNAAGDLDQSQAPFCALANDCHLLVWYDQSTFARHADGGAVATNAVLIFNCDGTGKPCLRSGGSWTNGPVVTPAATSTVAAVGKVDSTPATCAWLRYGGDQSLGSNAGGNIWLLWNNGTAITPPAANGVIHAGVGVFNGASSLVNIDGTETTGTVSTTVAAGNIYVATNHDAVIKCTHYESMWWNAYIMPPAERAAVIANQRAYWVP